VHAAVAGIGTFVSIVVVISLIGRGTPWAVLAAVALAAWCTYFYRLLHMAVIVRGDTLLARNLSATRRVERSSVADVTLGESHVAKSPNQTVVLRLIGGHHLSLDACARSTDSRRRRRRVDDFYRYLTEWSLGSPADVAPTAADPAPDRSGPGSGEAGDDATSDEAGDAGLPGPGDPAAEEGPGAPRTRRQ